MCSSRTKPVIRQTESAAHAQAGGNFNQSRPVIRTWMQHCLHRQRHLQSCKTREAHNLGSHQQRHIQRQDPRFISRSVTTINLINSESSKSLWHNYSPQIRGPPKHSGSKEDSSQHSKLDCEACLLSKSHQLPFLSSLPNATRPLEYVFMDLSGRINPPFFCGKEYYLKITDFFTRYRHVYLLS